MYDLVFIGGGLSGTLSLVYLLKQLGNSPRRTNGAGAELRLALEDRDRDFGAGLPYGRLADPRFLLNETVRTMDICGFHDWLVRRRSCWLGMLQQDPGEAVKSWLEANQQPLQAAAQDPRQYDNLFLPRCVFGRFMRELLHASIAQAQQDGAASVDLLADEVITLTRVPDGSLRAGLRSGGVLSGRRVLLGLGSLPLRPAHDLEGPGCIHDFYRQGPGALRAFCERTKSSKGGPRRAVIIGSNSAAMEALHSIHFDRELCGALHAVLVISPSGRLPDAEPSHNRPAFEAQQTQQLARSGRAWSADNLIAALRHDAGEAQRAAYTSLDFSAAAIPAFQVVFARLAPDDQRKFVERYGACFTALNRHTPPEYANAGKSLMKSGKLRVMRGRVTAVEQHGDDLLVTMETGSEEHERVQAAAVINCSGSEPLHQTSVPLLRNILGQDGLARINAAGTGIHVTPDFEASPGVFVMGPLLAGHSSEARHIWNLESAPRIHEYAQHVAGVLAAGANSGERDGPA